MPTASDSRLSGTRWLPSPVLTFRDLLPPPIGSPGSNLGGREGGGVEGLGSEGDMIPSIQWPSIGSQSSSLRRK
ncbi:hypothetical protein DPMN_146248 [Dreissena polymorpha]|uniref:Uncharacterized protein n=1 Tax=Dreissena polymorpha TaxID=45954 RepID=A0A9D4F7J5_DREPO|nr:hypothetical protein DPMN_146248 [Dreissena polymorpha]